MSRKLKIENYFFDSNNLYNDNKKLILVIYDIVDNKRRYKFVKFIERYGFRVQKSAFELILDSSLYSKLISDIPKYITKEDNVRVYRLPLGGDVTAWGSDFIDKEDVIII